MFENFDARGRQTVALAHEQARELRHPYIGTAHLLLGLLVGEPSDAVSAMHAAGLTAERARNQVLAIVGEGPDPVRGQMPITPGAHDALMRANRARLSLGEDAVGPEHLLLALLRDDEGTAMAVMTRVGVDPDVIRARLVGGGDAGGRA